MEWGSSFNNLKLSDFQNWRQNLEKIAQPVLHRKTWVITCPKTSPQATQVLYLDRRITSVVEARRAFILLFSPTRAQTPKPKTSVCSLVSNMVWPLHIHAITPVKTEWIYFPLISACPVAQRYTTWLQRPWCDFNWETSSICVEIVRSSLLKSHYSNHRSP